LNLLNVKSYPQALSTTVQNLWDTPKATHKVIQPLTGGCTLDAYNNTTHFVGKTKNEYLSILDDKKIKIKKAFLLLFTSLIAMLGTSPANAANYSIDHLKLYAHSRILDYKEFQCFNKIITKESRWSYTARNGSHYGLGQMRSKHYRDLDPFRQIDATIRYNHKRYLTQCNAWSFHLKHGYY
jgi:hypothetical protein